MENAGRRHAHDQSGHNRLLAQNVPRTVIAGLPSRHCGPAFPSLRACEAISSGLRHVHKNDWIASSIPSVPAPYEEGCGEASLECGSLLLLSLRRLAAVAAGLLAIEVITSSRQQAASGKRRRAAALQMALPFIHNPPRKPKGRGCSFSQ